MTSIPDRSAEPSGRLPIASRMLAEGVPAERHLVGLEPRHAWRLDGLAGSGDEIVVPGILLDDLGRSAAIEARMAHGVFCQMQAMAALTELRMIEARSLPRPQRLRPEVNVWLVEGKQAGRRLDVTAVVGLDRVVFAPDRHLAVDTMALSQIVPGEKAWR